MVPAGAEHRVSPNNRSAERSTLGCMLRDNSVIDDVMLLVNKESFYVYAHQLIASIIFDYHERGATIDLTVLYSELVKRGQAEDVGGPSYLAELWDDGVSPSNVEHHARMVRETAIQRQLIRVASEILARAYEPSGPIEQVLEDAEKMMFAIGDLSVTGTTIDTRKLMSVTCGWIARRKVSIAADGVLTGFADLDKLTAGLHNGEFTIVAARPSVGKTALAVQIATNAARAGFGSLFVSLEQSREEIGCRLICSEARISGSSIRSGYYSDDDVPKIGEASDIISQWPIEWDDTPTQTLTRIASNARRLKRRNVVRALFIDYLQLIAVEPARGENREQQVAGLSRRLKLLARELKIPVVCLCQLNRQAEARADKEPQLSDLRESGALEQDADCVLMLWRPDEADKGTVKVKVAKQRNGPLGIMPLMFMGQYTRFADYPDQTPGSSDWVT
jgi:replicative DNA helicase